MGFQWALQPFYVRVFFLYVAVVLGLSIVRAIRISRQISPRSPQMGASLELCMIKADGIGKLSKLTLFLSALICTYGAYPTWADHFNNNKITGQQALFEAVMELLQRVSVGLFAATVLFGISSYLKLSIAKRRASAASASSR